MHETNQNSIDTNLLLILVAVPWRRRRRVEQVDGHRDARHVAAAAFSRLALVATEWYNRMNHRTREEPQLAWFGRHREEAVRGERHQRIAEDLAGLLQAAGAEIRKV